VFEVLRTSPCIDQLTRRWSGNLVQFGTIWSQIISHRLCELTSIYAEIFMTIVVTVSHNITNTETNKQPRATTNKTSVTTQFVIAVVLWFVVCLWTIVYCLLLLQRNVTKVGIRGGHEMNRPSIDVMYVWHAAHCEYTQGLRCC